MAQLHDTRDLNRIAALALGLAYAGRSTSGAVAQLVEESDGDLQVLVEARSHVTGAEVIDQDARMRARQLLDAAIRRAGGSKSRFRHT